MTREEAISHLLKYAPDLGDSVSNSFVSRLIEDIYDYFQSMTCKNCKYFEAYPSVCCNGESPLCAEVVDEDFGCNRFIRKVEND